MSPSAPASRRRPRPTGSRRATKGAAAPDPRSEPSSFSGRGQATRAEIVAAARTVFAQMGFGGTRMDDIARAAGISRASLYHYFPSKREVFVEIGRAAAVAFRQVVEVADGLPDASSRDDLERFVRAYLAYLDDHGSVVSTWGHATWDDHDLRALGVDVQLRSYAVIGGVLARVRGATVVDPTLEGIAVLGMIDRLWYYARVGGAVIEETQLVDTLVHELQAVLGIVAGDPAH